MPEVAGSPNVLEAIVGATRRIVEVRKNATPTDTLERAAMAQPATGHALERALTSSGGTPRVIAECKRRSPSRGVLRARYDPAAIATSYERGGAAAISVLTEPTFFDGAPAHLQEVRSAVRVPVLRKDFIVDRYQLLEARAWGADAVLLIVAVVDQSELSALIAASGALSLDALVEVHGREELQRALDAGARIVGVNNRNLKTLQVSRLTAEELGPMIPHGVIAVAESGLKARSDLERLATVGFDGFLIGERFMTAEDPGAALKELLS